MKNINATRFICLLLVLVSCSDDASEPIDLTTTLSGTSWEFKSATNKDITEGSYSQSFEGIRFLFPEFEYIKGEKEYVDSFYVDTISTLTTKTLIFREKDCDMNINRTGVINVADAKYLIQRYSFPKRKVFNGTNVLIIDKDFLYFEIEGKRKNIWELNNYQYIEVLDMDAKKGVDKSVSILDETTRLSYTRDFDVITVDEITGTLSVFEKTITLGKEVYKLKE